MIVFFGTQFSLTSSRTSQTSQIRSVNNMNGIWCLMACVCLMHNGGEWTWRESERKTLIRKTRQLEPEMGGSELSGARISLQEWGSLIYSFSYLAYGSSDKTGR